MGRAREAFERYSEAAGLEPPPRGALAGYAEEVVAQAPALRADCGEDDEVLHALREMENAARGLLAWCEQEAAATRTSRAARGTARATKTPVPVAQAPAVTRLADRAAARRAAMRSRR